MSIKSRVLSLAAILALTGGVATVAVTSSTGGTATNAPTAARTVAFEGSAPVPSAHPMRCFMPANIKTGRVGAPIVWEGGANAGINMIPDVCTYRVLFTNLGPVLQVNPPKPSEGSYQAPTGFYRLINRWPPQQPNRATEVIPRTRGHHTLECAHISGVLEPFTKGMKQAPKTCDMRWYQFSPASNGAGMQLAAAPHRHGSFWFISEAVKASQLHHVQVIHWTA
jgi:hypothetical protein